MGEGKGGDVQVDAPDGRRRIRATALWIGVFATAVAVAAGAMVVRRAAQQPPLTADEALARVKAFVATAGTGRFTVAERYTSDTVDPTGELHVETMDYSGEFAIPDRVHKIGTSWEEVVVPAGRYYRSTTPDGGVDEGWTFTPPPDEIVENKGPHPSGLFVMGVASGQRQGIGGPFDLAAVLGRLDAMSQPAQGVLEGTFSAGQLLPESTVAIVEAFQARDGNRPSDLSDGFLDGYRVLLRLVHQQDGRLDEISITSLLDKPRVGPSTIRFSGWGEPVEILVPIADELDHTPTIAERALSRFDAFPVLAPANPPPALVLSWAGLLAVGEHADCPMVSLNYRSTESIMLSLSLSSAKTSCVKDPPAEPGQPIRIGAYDGQLWTTEVLGESTRKIRAVTGGATIEMTSNVPLDQFMAAAQSLGPLDFSTQPIVRRPPP